MELKKEKRVQKWVSKGISTGLPGTCVRAAAPGTVSTGDLCANFPVPLLLSPRCPKYPLQNRIELGQGGEGIETLKTRIGTLVLGQESPAA